MLLLLKLLLFHECMEVIPCIILFSGQRGRLTSTSATPTRPTRSTVMTSMASTVGGVTPFRNSCGRCTRVFQAVLLVVNFVVYSYLIGAFQDGVSRVILSHCVGGIDIIE